MLNSNGMYTKNRNEILVKTRFLQPSLTKSEKKAADFLLDNPWRVLDITLAEYANASGSSQASILRFCRRLGIEGFPELKLLLSAVLSSEEQEDIGQEVNPDDSILEIMQKVFWFNIQTLQDTLSLMSEDCEKALEAFLAAEGLTFFGIGDASDSSYSGKGYGGKLIYLKWLCNRAILSAYHSMICFLRRSMVLWAKVHCGRKQIYLIMQKDGKLLPDFFYEKNTKRLNETERNYISKTP